MSAACASDPLELAEIRFGIVCPMANEAATAVEFVDAVLAECRRYPFRWVQLFVVVDNASEDDTRALLERHRERCPELHVIWAPENQGVADAYIRGYKEALNADSDWILEIDAGFSHAPTDIGTFVEAMATGGVDCVFGSRFIAGGGNFGTLRRRFISRGGTALTNAVLGTSLSDMTSGFQLFTRAALEDVLARGINSKGPFFQTEMKIHCRSMRIAEIPIQYNAGSHQIGRRAITESLANVWRLVWRRLRGEL